jgi:amidohydrolase
MRPLIATLLLTLAASAQNFTQADINAVYPSVESLYLDLHRNPELSLHEQNTAAKLADALRKLGFEVSTGVGGTGVVGILNNGTGPTVMLRTELDALPVHEDTGLPYASHVITKDAAGNDVPVMHACGHDIHMSSWFGTATLMSRSRDRWHGTLMMVAQPAEEIGAGAPAMLKDGLFTRFPKPNYVFAVHDDSGIPSGQVGFIPGYALSNADSVDITFYGKGGHGAMPQTTVDPIVIAARFILSVQTIVSRELAPTDPAVITVGSIHGGTKHNIIPDEVHLQLTVRSYKEEVRKHIFDSMRRIADAEAAAAAAPKPPLITSKEGGHATYNDPALTERIAAAEKHVLGDANVYQIPPKMVSEDFSEYGLAGVPSTQFFVGAVNPEKFKAAAASGEALPSLHSSMFAPDREPTLKTAMEVETTALLDLFNNPPAH